MKCLITDGLIAILILGFAQGEVWAKDQNKQLVITGNASWYGKNDLTDPWPHKVNADGTAFDEDSFTCAMRHREFGYYYRVTNLSNGKSVIVKHADYGPARKYRGKRLNRLIDLSKAAFKEIADLKSGVIKVRVEKTAYRRTHKPHRDQKAFKISRASFSQE